MARISRRKFLSVLGLVPFAGLIPGSAPFLPPPLRTPPSGGFHERYFPDALLKTQEGKEVRFYSDLLKNKIVVINFIYTHCQGLCPRQTANLVQVQRELGDHARRNIFFYSISLKPKEDTPEKLREYAEAHHVGPGWRFLTGDPADVERLRLALGFVDPDPVLDRDTSQHIGMILYGNEAKQRWAACPSLTEPKELAKYIGWMEWPKGHQTREG